MKNRSGGSKNGVLARHLKWLCDQKISRSAEHSYCAIMLRGEYPYVADLFESLAASDMRGFRELGQMLRYLGVDPISDIRIHTRGRRGENIETIISCELDIQRQGIDALERIHSLTDDSRICEVAERMRLEISENIKALERLLYS